MFRVYKRFFFFSYFLSLFYLDYHFLFKKKKLYFYTNHSSTQYRDAIYWNVLKRNNYNVLSYRYLQKEYALN
jgi:hypothetical protein